MNLQLQPRIHSVLPHPHSICALRDTETLTFSASTGSSDPTKLIGAHQLPGHEISNAISPASHSRSTSSSLFNAHRPAAPDKAASFKSLYPNRPARTYAQTQRSYTGGPDTALRLPITNPALDECIRRFTTKRHGLDKS